MPSPRVEATAEAYRFGIAPRVQRSPAGGPGGSETSVAAVGEKRKARSEKRKAP